MKKILLFTLLIVASAWSASAQTNRTSLYKVNDTLPSLSFIDMNDQVVDLGTLTKGKPVLLIFYKADWCGPCIEQLDEIKSYYKSLNIKGISMYAITTQPVETMKETITKYGFKFPLLKDEGGAAITKLGITSAGMPIQTVMVVDRNRIIRYIYSSADLKERPVAQQVYEEAIRVSETYK